MIVQIVNKRDSFLDKSWDWQYLAEYSFYILFSLFAKRSTHFYKKNFTLVVLFCFVEDHAQLLSLHIYIILAYIFGDVHDHI